MHVCLCTCLCVCVHVCAFCFVQSTGGVTSGWTWGRVTADLTETGLGRDHRGLIHELQAKNSPQAVRAHAREQAASGPLWGFLPLGISALLRLASLAVLTSLAVSITLFLFNLFIIVLSVCDLN